MIQIAIFASGTGTNAQKIIDHLTNVPDMDVTLVVSNKAKAGVLQIAEREGIPSLLLNRSFFYESDQLLFELNQQNIDFIVLAGFLWLVPPYLIKAYKQRIINIHPALLPEYGGKGMYGNHVHAAVKRDGVDKTGITIHYVNEKYDDGAIIFQASCVLAPQDTIEDIRSKVQLLEHEHFAKVVEKVAREAKERNLK